MLKKISELSLRFRTFLLFLCLALSVPAVWGPTLYFALDHIETYQDPAATLLLFGLGGGVAMIALIVMIGVLFDLNMAAPIQSLIRDVQTILHGNRDHDVDVIQGRYLDHLPETVRELAQDYRRQRTEVNAQITRATEATAQQKSTLEAILKDLYEGVIICNLNNQIMLYNQHALALLHVSGDVGLGRSLFSVIDSPSIMHSLRRLRNRLAEKRHLKHPEGVSASFVCATNDGRYTFEARMTLILDEQDQPTSYVLNFEDKTTELSALGKRDHLLRDATEGMRQPLANLRAASEMIAHGETGMSEVQERFIDVLVQESKKLSERLDSLAEQYQGLATKAWPMTDIYSANLLGLVTLRLNDDKNMKAMMTGVPTWFLGDSHSLLLALVEIVQRVYGETGNPDIDLQTSVRGERIHIDVIWEGHPLSSALMDEWMNVELKESIGGMSLRDILEHHQCEIWSEAINDKWSRIRLPMMKAHRPYQDHASETLPSRPEFYDFKLIDHHNEHQKELRELPLSDIPFVVFDTETTGLQPSGGDEIIAIAGVRILNGRILTGESFARMVNPNRTIPKASIKFHGITDEMVRDKPPAEIILPQFSSFTKDCVLVAHNAAFDMKFLEKKQDDCGVKFDHIVLDTLLLSVFLHDHTGQHTLDEIAKRFGVEVEGRHTAIGDALVTAGIFLRMIPMLKARGINTLDDALKASQKIVDVRAQQAEF